MTDTLQNTNYLREIAFIIFSQKKIGIFGVLIVLIATAAVIFYAPPKYEAVATLLLKGKQLESNLGSAQRSQSKAVAVTKSDLYSEVEIVTSQEVRTSTASSLLDRGLAQMLGLPVDTPVDEVTETFQRKLLSRLKITVVASSNVIKASLRWPNPDHAKIILDSLIDNYFAYRQEIFNPNEARRFVSKLVDTYEKNLDQKQAEHLVIITRLGTPDVDLEIKQNLLDSTKLKESLRNLETQWIEVKASADHIEEQLALEGVRYFASIDNETVRLLGRQLNELIAKRDQLAQLASMSKSKTGGDTKRSDMNRRLDELEVARTAAMNAQVEKQSRQLKSEIHGLLEKFRAQAAAYYTRITKMRRQLQAISKRNIQLRQAEIKLTRVRDEIQLLTESYKTFFQRREEAALSHADKGAGLLAQVVVLQQASAGTKPVFPNSKKLFPIGVVSAILTGFSLCFLFHFFDHTVKRPEDVESALGIPVLFSISDQGPKWARRVRQSLPPGIPKTPIKIVPGGEDLRRPTFAHADAEHSASRPRRLRSRKDTA